MIAQVRSRSTSQRHMTWYGKFQKIFPSKLHLRSACVVSLLPKASLSVSGFQAPSRRVLVRSPLRIRTHIAPSMSSFTVLQLHWASTQPNSCAFLSLHQVARSVLLGRRVLQNTTFFARHRTRMTHLWTTGTQTGRTKYGKQLLVEVWTTPLTVSRRVQQSKKSTALLARRVDSPCFEARVAGVSTPLA